MGNIGDDICYKRICTMLKEDQDSLKDYIYMLGIDALHDKILGLDEKNRQEIMFAIQTLFIKGLHSLGIGGMSVHCISKIHRSITRLTTDDEFQNIALSSGVSQLCK